MASDPIEKAAWLLSFHGSEIRRAWLSEEKDLHIAFSAAAATQAEGTEGYLSGVTLVVSQVAAHSLPSEHDLSLLLGGIAEGHVVLADQLLRQLPVPARQTGPLSLNLGLISGITLSASGHSVRIELAESATFRESWAC